MWREGERKGGEGTEREGKEEVGGERETHAL